MSKISARIDRERQMDHMAGQNGADLDLALQSGAMSPSEYQVAVENCLGCTDPEDCRARIDAGLGGFPEYCRNAALIGGVAAAMPQID